MWIVRLALARPYTFIVFSLVLLLISPVALLRTPVDIFPSINIPVISVIWTFTRSCCPGAHAGRLPDADSRSCLPGGTFPVRQAGPP